MTSTDIPIPPAVVEAAARAAAEDRGYDWEMHPRFHKAFRRMATAALRAGLAAWPGMWNEQENGSKVLFDGTPNLILPLQENSNDKA